MQRSFRRIAEFSLVVLSMAILSLGAQGQTIVADRIVQPIDDLVVTTLKGNVQPLARAQYDLGPAPQSQPMNHMQLVLQRSAAQEAALEAFLAETQVKDSPDYHKWLTPQQFGTLYGPSDADIQKLTAWLTGEGFTVNQVSSGRTFIDFTGSVAQVQSAFHTTIHMYQANGISFVANVSDPTIPSALVPVIAGVAHLNTVPLRPQHVKGVAAKFDSQQHRFVPAASKINPNYTVDLDGFPNLVMVPADAATIYDTPNSFNSKFTGTTSYTGAGVTIGIMGQSSIDPTLVQNYRNLFVGDTKAPIISNLDGVADSPGDDGESYLDNEVSGGLAPGATLHFYTASATTDNGVLTSAQAAIEDNTIDILSMSYGSCELFNTTSGNAGINAMWQQAAAQGITVLVSAADSGSAGCDDADTEEDASGPLAVNGLASTPWDIAVGGTDFDVLATGTFTNYVSASVGSATTFYRSALGYIPEATWNDSTLNNTTVSKNLPLTANINFTADTIAAGSGGPSNCSVNSSTVTPGGQYQIGTCTSGYPKPSWQTGIGVPNDQARDIPDVSFLAGDGFYGASWAVCDNSTTGFDSSGNGGTANCLTNASGDFFTNGYGGTSAAAPAFAGIMALVVQKTGERQGQAAPILYSLFSSTPSVFHDVTTGNNSVSCNQTSTTTATCIKNSQGYFFESGYNTTTGYDLASGLGSVDATLLVNSWTSAAGSLLVANLVATPSAATITTAEPLSFTVTVTPLAAGGATPAGTVSVTDGIYKLPTPVALVNGSATITIPADSLTANAADTFTVSYAPPATGAVYANASAFVSVAVTEPPTAGFAITGANITITTPGQTGTSALSVTPGGGFTGAVNLTCSVAGPTGATSLPTCSLSPTPVVITGAAAATTSLNVVTTATTSVGNYAVTVNGADTTGMFTGTVAITAAVGTKTISFTPAPTTATIASPGQSGTSTLSLTSNYVGGTINFGFVLATAPSNAETAYNPACTAPTLTTANGVATVTATCTSTAVSKSALSYPMTHEKERWYEGAGGAALACVLFFGIPARRRGWKSMLSLLVILVTMAGLGCGGGGGGGGGGGTIGTTTGTYTYTVTGTDTTTGATATPATATLTVVVN